MPFDLTVETARDGQFNWFDLPEEDRAALERKRDEFHTMQFDPQGYLRIHGPNSSFDKPWTEITGIRIEG